MLTNVRSLGGAESFLCTELSNVEPCILTGIRGGERLFCVNMQERGYHQTLLSNL